MNRTDKQELQREYAKIGRYNKPCLQSSPRHWISTFIVYIIYALFLLHVRRHKVKENR